MSLLPYTIYAIRCNDTFIDAMYIGSTSNLKKRKACHKYNCNNQNAEGYNLYVYEFMREFGGWANWEIVPLAHTTKQHRLQLERYYYDQIPSVSRLNSHCPNRKMSEYYKVNKHKMITRSKNYYINNKAFVTKRAKKLFKCKCGTLYTYANRTNHKRTPKHVLYMQTDK